MREAVVVLLVLAGLMAAPAAAQSPSFIKDSANDGKGPLDVVRVALGPRTDGRLRGEITMEGVWFSYADDASTDEESDDVWALRGVDLEVPPGQTLALVGATGAGKSTFAKLVARFYDPQEGRVLIDGQDLRGVQQLALRRQLGIVPQEGFLFSGTVRVEGRVTVATLTSRGGPLARSRSTRPRSSSPLPDGLAQTR